MNEGSQGRPAWIYSPPDGQPLVPANPGYADRFRLSFKGQRLMELLGVSADAAEPGAVELSVPYRENLTQQHGLLHGGLVATLLDSSCGFAALTLFPADTAVLTVEYKVNFLRPATGARLVTRGQVIKPGKTLTVSVGEAHTIAGDGTAKLVATAQATVMLLPAGQGFGEG